jgi:hypothetical protein
MSMSSSSSSESDGLYYDPRNDKTKKKKRERRENRNGMEEKEKLGKNTWELRHALLRPVPELKNLLQSQIIVQEETNTKLRADWGPKARLFFSILYSMDADLGL